MAWIYAFLIGGIISLLYLYGIQRGLAALPKPQGVETNSAASNHESQMAFTAYLQPDAPYPAGIPIAGIIWREEYVDIRLDLVNGPTAAQSVDFSVQLDTSIGGIGQLSQFPNITAFPDGSPPPAWLQGTDTQGKPFSLPMIPVPGTASIAPAYRVQCLSIFANATVHFVIASIAIAPMENGQLPKQLFGARRPPRVIRIKGKYETKNAQDTETHPIDFSYQFRQPPSNLTLRDLFESDFPDAVMKGREDYSFTLPNGQEVIVTKQLYLDAKHREKFVGFFVPSFAPNSHKTEDVCLYLASHYDAALEMKHQKIKAFSVGGEITNPEELAFVRRVYIYHQDILNARESSEIEKRFRAHGASAVLRGPEYLSLSVLSRLNVKPPS